MSSNFFICKSKVACFSCHTQTHWITWPQRRACHDPAVHLAWVGCGGSPPLAWWASVALVPAVVTAVVPAPLCPVQNKARNHRVQLLHIQGLCTKEKLQFEGEDPEVRPHIHSDSSLKHPTLHTYTGTSLLVRAAYPSMTLSDILDCKTSADQFSSDFQKLIQSKQLTGMSNWNKMGELP